MKHLILGLALCLTAACATEKKTAMTDASQPAGIECKTDCSKPCCADKAAECSTKKVCPVTGKEIN